MVYKHKLCSSCGKEADNHIPFCECRSGQFTQTSKESSPCPVCNSTMIQMHSNGGCNNFSMMCHSCGISLSIEGWSKGLDMINKWNNLKNLK